MANDESLTEYEARLRALADSQRIRIHRDYHDPKGNVIVKPVISYLVDGGGTPVSPVREDTGLTKTYYPGSIESGTDCTNTLNVQTLTATAAAVNVQPVANYVNTVQYIRAAGNGAFAANRELNCYIYDGTDTIAFYRSGAAALVGTEDGLIHPTDEFTAVATYAGTRNEFDIHNGTYLRFVATGLAAAEEISLYTHMISRCAGGL